MSLNTVSLLVYSPANRTAIMPLKNTPSNVPAPPMLATGAPSLGIFSGSAGLRL